MVRVRALAIGVVGALLLMAAPASAQTDDGEPALGGYTAAAAGWAYSFQPFLPALLPTGDAPAETTLSLSAANVKSGGNALGRASILYPGSAAANLGPLVAQGAGQPAIGALVPPYPGVVEATAKDGEVARSLPAGMTMRAFGSPRRAEGDVRTPDVNFPGFLKIDSVSSNSFSEVTDVDVSSGCEVHLEGVTILGLIKIAAIHSRSTTSSTGSTATAGGALQVVGLTVGGLAAELTADGIHATGLPPQADPVPGVLAPFPNSNPDVVLNQLLASLGVTIKLTRPVEKISGGAADRLANGVFISIINPAVAGSHLDFTLASTGSTAQATLPVDLSVGGTELTPEGPDLSAGGLGGTDVEGTTFGSSPLGDVALGPSTSPGSALDSGAGGDLTPALATYKFKGVSWRLILLVLAVSVLVARWMRRFLQSRLLS
jgi:hypothetical protein